MSELTPGDTTPVMERAGRRRIPRVALFFALLVGSALLSLGWATSSPVGASPDEQAHMIYAWGVSTGQTLPWNADIRTPANSAAMTIVQVPQAIRDRPDETCYKFKAATPACSKQATDPANLDAAATYMTRYPPIYYLLVGIPMRIMLAIGVSGSRMLVLTRVVSGLISAALMGWAAWAASRRFGKAPAVLAVAVTLTPQFLFLSASVNPNGFEIASAFAVAAFVMSAFFDARHGGRIRADTSVGLIVCSLCLGLARPASLVWLVVLLALTLLRVDGKGVWRRFPAWLMAAVGVVVAISAVWFVYLNTLRGGGISDHDRANWAAISPVERALFVILKFDDLMESGYGSLGWMDTQLPLLFFIVWLIVAAYCVGHLLVTGGRRPLLRPRWALAALAAFMVAVAGQSYLAAFGWQGRYFLPCLAAFIVLLIPAMALHSATHETVTRMAITVTLINVVLDAASLFWNLGRYLYGYKTAFVRFTTLPFAKHRGSWQPFFGLSAPLWFGTVGMALVAVVLVVILRSGAGRSPLTPAVSPAPDARALSSDTRDATIPDALMPGQVVRPGSEDVPERTGQDT